MRVKIDVSKWRKEGHGFGEPTRTEGISAGMLGWGDVKWSIADQGFEDWSWRGVLGDDQDDTLQAQSKQFTKT